MFKQTLNRLLQMFPAASRKEFSHLPTLNQGLRINHDRVIKKDNGKT